MRHWPWSIEASLLALLAVSAPAHAQQAQGQPQSSTLAVAVAASTQPAPAKLPPAGGDGDNPFWDFFRDAEWYGSWGYSKQYWAPSDIHVSQPSLGNNFTLYNVHGTDEFSSSDLFNPTDFFGPEYNIRIGRFINDERTIAVEFSLDHTKYQTTIGQTAQVSGQINGMPVNSSQVLSTSYFNEVLHNGANHVMLNGVYRYPLIGQTNETLSVAAIGKAGLGIMLPHTSDTIMGNANSVGPKTLGNSVGLNNGWWQLNGWTAGVEGGLRVVLYKPVYLEVTDKIAYARLDNLPAYLGTIQQSLWMNEIVVSIGFTYDGPKAGSR
jgi:hypothetical protein